MGRIELNYRKVCSEAFGRWKKRPSEEKFWSIVGEYRDAYLLFVYEAEGSLWGAWDTSEKCLPRHKLSADLRSPAPIVKEFYDWKSEYVSKKNAKSTVPANFVNRAPIGASLHGNVRGVGIGVGIGGGIGGGGGEEQTPANNAGVITPVSTAGWFEDSFWPIWPVKESKEKAKAASRKIRAEERSRVIEGVIQQSAKIRSMERPIHAATWINQRRWEDEPPQLFEAPRQKSFMSDVENVMRSRVERGIAPL